MGSLSTRAKLLFVAPLLLVFLIVVVFALRLVSATSDVAAPSQGLPASAAPTTSSYHPLRITPPLTAVERSANEFLQKNGDSGNFTVSRADRLPTAATSAALPPINTVDLSVSSVYAMAFTQELLDLNFATSKREELLAWTSYNNAPNSLVSMPEAEQQKILPASLTAPPALVPTSKEWQRLAASDTRWGVSGLVISVSPLWTEMLATGWKPVDPLMVAYDVSGTLTVISSGHATKVESIFFALTLGGASWHRGYGAVAVNDWTVN
ncbi:MAG: hypothetical protein WA860_14080 [Acidimicrobiales bacterium]